MPEVLHFVGISKHLLQLGRVAVCFPVLDSVAVGHAITSVSYTHLLGLLMMLLLLSRIALFCQAQTAGIEEKEVLRNEDVIFHQIDEHTWFGTGHLMANESLYLVEGETKAILIDAGTKIKDLDKLVASITDKPVTLVATHVHPDHTGSAIDYFPEIYINPADTIGIPEFMPNYKGKVCFLTDGEILDLGGRTLEVVSVSYTHLDVYKRQLHTCSWRPASCP